VVTETAKRLHLRGALPNGEGQFRHARQVKARIAPHERYPEDR
jgi:hypothetical protein